MFANPEVSAFIDRLIGGQTPRGGTPPPSPGYRGALARGLLGDITRPPIKAPVPAAAIEAYRHPLMQPSPTEGVGRSSGSGAPGQANAPSGGGNTGASGLAGGIGKLGAGIEGGLEQLAAARQDAGKVAAMHQGDAAFPKFDSGVSGADGTSLSGGVAANSGGSLPSFARPGIGTGPVGASIGGVEGLPQFLNGIKAGEAVPYSGLSSTGAIGAYGLTGGFIKQYAPSAGLPTDRASYMNNPTLQDQLAAHAATQMYNKFGSWPSVANAWLTGSPTATVSQPGNMSPSAYVAKVMRAAGMSGSADQIQDRQQDAADAARTSPESAQPSTIPGQGNPHAPGFDPSSVQFTNTPIGQQSTLTAPEPGIQQGTYNGQPYTYQTQPALGPQGMILPSQATPGGDVNPLALALAGGQMPPVDPGFGGFGSGLFG